jgi:hypothetical protein
MDILYRDGEGDQKYGPPPGRHEATFVGLTLDDVPEFMANSKFKQRGDNDKMLHWKFRLSSGEEVFAYTGTRAVKKSGCLKVMDALSAGQRSPDGIFHAALYINKAYTLLFALSESGASTYISAILPSEPTATTTNGSSAKSRTAPRSPPPPPPQASPAREKMLWYQPVPNGPPELGTAEEIRTHLSANGLDPAKVLVCPEDSQEWVAAASCGISTDIPF